MENKIILQDIRITFLGADIVRVERKYRGKFCDENTFFIPDRESLGEEGPAYALEEGVLSFGEYTLYLPAGRTLRGMKLEKNGKTVYRYRRTVNSGELPPPHKTPQVFALSDRPRILIPEGGYSARRKGKYRVYENAEDVYLLFAEGDAQKLRRLYVALTGRCELVRLATLGGWNSKYYAYTEAEAKQLILDYERYGVPLDNMVIDTDWRLKADGTGYEINRTLFPDMKGFLAFAHRHGVEIMFNDHPEPVEGASVFEPREISFREKNLQALMKLGLDTWWYDRNWHTHLVSPTKNVKWETFGLYLYHDITENFYRKAAHGSPVHRRPVVMGNVVDISNGVYCGISDSASHRYAIQWTGDIASCAYAFAQEVENLVRCAENCIPYMNSDCGGHTGNPDKEQFIRWMQYGTLSPVFRPHCTNSVQRTREPWLYDGETLDIVREYALLRYRLLPYLYANAYGAYETGMPMFRSLSLAYPQDRRAAARRDEYLLGNNLLIAPICGVVPQLVGEECFTSPVRVTFYNGHKGEGEPIAHAEWKNIFMDLRHEPPMKGVPVYHFSAKLSAKIKFNRDMRLCLRNDDGATVYLDGKCIFRDEETHSAVFSSIADLKAGEEHTLDIEYFQAEGEAFLGLYMAERKEGDTREVYLPAGRWMDLFDGKIYAGKRTIKKVCGLRTMPLFVRLGALIPLAAPAQTTRAQSWQELVYDFYPDRESADAGYLYEDDGETTAYRYGAFARSDYSAGFDSQKNAFIVRLKAAQGQFEGPRAVKRREITVKYHLLKGVDRVMCVYVNGKSVPFGVAQRSEGFPLDTGEPAPDGAVLTVRFSADPAEEQTVEFYLKSV